MSALQDTKWSKDDLQQPAASSPPVLDLLAVRQGGERNKEEEIKEDIYPSVVPFLPPLTDATIKEYWTFYLSAVAVIITFGALLAPALELHLGMGGEPAACGRDGEQQVRSSE